MVFETLVSKKLNHLTQLIAQENSFPIAWTYNHTNVVPLMSYLGNVSL